MPPFPHPDFWSNVVQHTIRTKAKGTGLILTCQHAVECDSAANGVIASVTPASCLLQVHSTLYSTASTAGDLQELLANFLTGEITNGHQVVM